MYPLIGARDCEYTRTFFLRDSASCRIMTQSRLLSTQTATMATLIAMDGRIQTVLNI